MYRVYNSEYRVQNFCVWITFYKYIKDVSWNFLWWIGKTKETLTRKTLVKVATETYSCTAIKFNFWVYEILFSIIIFEFQKYHWKWNENYCERDGEKCQTFDKLQKNEFYQKQKKSLNILGLLCKIEKEMQKITQETWNILRPGSLQDREDLQILCLIF